MGVGKELDTKPLVGASDRGLGPWWERWHWSHRFCTKCKSSEACDEHITEALHVLWWPQQMDIEEQGMVRAGLQRQNWET